MKQVLLYLPVIHSGYEVFLRRHSDAAEILLLGEGFTRAYPALAKDIRALPAARAAAYLAATWDGPPPRVIQPDDLPAAVTGEVLAVPDEEITRDLVASHSLAEGREVVFERTFLRWDRAWATERRPVSPSQRITADLLPRELLAAAAEAAARSSDWWRQVGAVAARDGQVIGSAWNQHLPSEYAPYLSGDPRDAFARGVRADLSTAIHAEAAVIGQAAREGTPLKGADLYTTTFPCPACARLIAAAGFARCYFTGQYSVLDGQEVLEAAGVSLVWVDTRA